MRQPVVTSMVLLALASAPSACGNMSSASGANSAAGEGHPLVGGAAPSFELPSPDARKKISLIAHGGKVVIIDFWATWCAPCHESFPAYQRLAQKFGSKLVVIGISVDEEPAGIANFVKETGATFPIAWDDGQVVSKSYQPPTMPTSFVIDKSGIVRFVHSGFHSGEEEALEKEVSELIR